MPSSARVMTDHEAAETEARWNHSAEKAALDERQRKLKEVIAEKCGSYSKRC